MTRFVVVTLLLAAVAIVLRLRSRGTGPARTLKITARAAIGRGTSLVVVEVEGRRLLVGAAANQMNVLAELGPVGDDVRDAVESSASYPQAEAPLRRPVYAPPAAARIAGSSAAAPQTFVERMRSLTVRTVDPAQRHRAGRDS